MIGASTTNKELADVLETITENPEVQSLLLTLQIEALDEAVERIRELPDEED